MKEYNLIKAQNWDQFCIIRQYRIGNAFQNLHALRCNNQQRSYQKILNSIIQGLEVSPKTKSTYIIQNQNDTMNDTNLFLIYVFEETSLHTTKRNQIIALQKEYEKKLIEYYTLKDDLLKQKNIPDKIKKEKEMADLRHELDKM